MTDRCEPPPELRGVDGWHWVQPHDWEPIPARWHAAENAGNEPRWTSSHHVPSGTPVWAYEHWGWRYLSQVVTPAEVEAIRAERDALKAGLLAEVNLASEERRRHEIEALYGPLLDADKAELATLRARVAELEGALRSADQFITNGIELGYIRMPSPGTPDSALKTPGIVRAALSPATEG